MTNILPAEFAELEPFVNYWALPTLNDRIQRRANTPMWEIMKFYDTAIARADQMVNFVGRYKPSEMPDDVERLYLLILGLIQAAVAVELHRQPRCPNAPYPNTLQLIEGRP